MSDLFANNQSNDYIHADLAECAGSADSASFEFLGNDEVGVIAGSDILQSMDLGDISQTLDGWVQQTKILEPGEVTFIQGLTKGISVETQKFYFDNSIAYTDASFPYFMTVDMSINYYRNFRYYQNSVKASGDYANTVDIATALNTALAAKSISVTAAYDPSDLTFTGDSAGYDFDISRIDVSLFQTYSTVRQTLTEDTSSAVPAYKYPNGAMLGYVLKVTYSSSITADSDKYVMINHVPDRLVYYEVSTGNTTSYVKYTKDVDVGLNAGLLCSTNTTTMSAADYLDYVQTNSKWEKVGFLRMWLAASDPTDSNTENLITGFYVYNPQSYDVQLNYMTIL
jgi:hypothetical protein